MKWPYAMCEVIASFFESGVVICAVTRITDECCSKRDNMVQICLYALFCTIIITALNSISLFSFFTMCIAILLAGFSTKYISKGSLLLGCMLISVFLCYAAQILSRVNTLREYYFYANFIVMWMPSRSEFLDCSISIALTHPVIQYLLRNKGSFLPLPPQYPKTLRKSSLFSS